MSCAQCKTDGYLTYFAEWNGVSIPFCNSNCAYDFLNALAVEAASGPECTKPPLGCVPEWLWKEQRVIELCSAIQRLGQQGNFKRNPEALKAWANELTRLANDPALLGDATP